MEIRVLSTVNKLHRSGRNKCGLVVTDVFTREVVTKALPDKRAETVTRAAAEIISDLVQDESNHVLTTDLSNEFQGSRRHIRRRAGHLACQILLQRLDRSIDDRDFHSSMKELQSKNLEKQSL